MRKIGTLTLICGMILGILYIEGCGKSAINIQQLDSKSDDSENEEIYLELSGHKGEMTYQLTDAYVTDKVEDVEKLLCDSPVYLNGEDGSITDVSPKTLVKTETGELLDGCRLLVVELKVTNIDAEYDVKNEYESPYTFRADNVFLCYVDENMQVQSYQNVEYYSDLKTNGPGWSTYNLEPGKSISYKVGFLIGNYVENMESGEYINADDVDGFVLSDTSGTSDGHYYRIKWEKR